MGKLLKILFVILLIITVSEAGYYLYIYQVNQSSNISSNKIGNFTINVPTLAIPTKEVFPAKPNEPIETLLAKGRIEQLGSVKFYNHENQNNGFKFYLTTEQTANVSTIQDQGNGSLKLTLVDDTGAVITGLIIDKRLTVYKLINGIRNPASIYDIKIGSGVIYVIKSNILIKEKSNEELVLL
jgi:hypothetical protein